MAAFPKSLRLRTRGQYQRMARSARRTAGEYILIDFRQGRSLNPKLGITVSKRYGKAHKRNRFKRLVREAFRLCHHLLPSGLEINIKPRSAAEKATMPMVYAELRKLLAV